MCTKGTLPKLMIGVSSESWAMDGCANLWQIWCAQNREQVEHEVTDWLYRNSHSLRIMGLQSLIPKGPSNLRRTFFKQPLPKAAKKTKSKP